MKSIDAFSGYHPVVNFIYFVLVLTFSMFFVHPAALLISFGTAMVYHIYLNGRKALRFQLMFMLPMMLMAALFNPAFNHEGATILTYLPSGNPLTLESIIYGVAAAVMLAGIITWFSCYSAVMTSDKFVYLFGKIIPAMSLIISMTLRFVPLFKIQLLAITQAQRCIGRDVSSGGVWQRVKTAITIISIMITWALENAIETADSMRSRGYGLPGRTAFSIYKFDDRDKYALAWLGFCGFYIVSAWASGGFRWQYYPTVKGVEFGVFTGSFLLIYLCLCLTPVILNVCEDLKWRRLG